MIGICEAALAIGRLHRPALHRGHHHGALARADRSIWSQRYGMAGARRVRAADIPVLALEDPASGAATSCATRSAARCDEDAPRRSCSAAPAWPTCRATLQAEFGVPVIDGVGAAVKQAEALVALGL